MKHMELALSLFLSLLHSSSIAMAGEGNRWEASGTSSLEFPFMQCEEMSVRG